MPGSVRVTAGEVAIGPGGRVFRLGATYARREGDPRLRPRLLLAYDPSRFGGAGGVLCCVAPAATRCNTEWWHSAVWLTRVGDEMPDGGGEGG